MRLRIIALLLPLLAALSSYAQRQLVARDFKPLPNDLTANTFGDMKKDQNGKTAALIKVRSTIEDLHFDGGINGIVSVENRPGEYWVYIPAKSRKLFVFHGNYGVVEFEYAPTVIEEARTYSMNIDPDGKEVSLETSVPRTEIVLDDDSIGVSPQTVYLPYGLHSVRARNGSMVFDGNIEVKRDDESRIVINMEDETEVWGRIHFTTDPEAVLYFNNELVGLNGEWTTTLPAGRYTIVARDPFDKASPQVTFFTVEPRQSKEVAVTPPQLSYGHLHIDTHPEGVTVTDDGEPLPTASDGDYTLTVGRHKLTFEKKHYHSQTKVYYITAGVRDSDVVTLRTKIHAHPYLGVGVNIKNYTGFRFILGCTFHNFDFSVNFTQSLRKEFEVDNWFFDGSDGYYSKSRERHTIISLGGRVGYRVKLGRAFIITPNLGYQNQWVLCYWDGVHRHSVTVGANAYILPSPHFGIFVAPEYYIPLNINNFCGTTTPSGGFGVSLGIVCII